MSQIQIGICPRCQQQFQRMPNTGDFIHECFGSDVLANESVQVIGDWADYTGSDVNVNSALKGGQENVLDQRAKIEGEFNPPRNSQGFPSTTFRQRRHLEWIPEDFFENPQNNNQTDDPETYDK